MAKEPAAKPFYSVLVLAFACSLLVSGAAVGLRPLQEANRQLDRKKNILRAAGIYTQESNIETLFEHIDTKMIELSSGKLLDNNQINPQNFDQLKAAQQPQTSRLLTKEQDLAGIRRLEKYALVYLVKKAGEIDRIILPIRGKGLWSTMYGYVALSSNLSTIQSITFYEHGETPGLGGEIENTTWQKSWQGKQLFDATGQVALEVVKGQAETNSPAYKHQVDGISGATLTTNGVNNLLQFWFGQHGYKPFFKRYAGGFNKQS